MMKRHAIVKKANDNLKGRTEEIRIEIFKNMRARMLQKMWRDYLKRVAPDGPKGEIDIFRI